MKGDVLDGGVAVNADTTPEELVPIVAPVVLTISEFDGEAGSTVVAIAGAETGAICAAAAGGVGRTPCAEGAVGAGPAPLFCPMT
jgi:hypothetical protein